MRLDEFSATSEIDGVLTKTEQIRFISFGFDILALAELFWSENIPVASAISLENDFGSNIMLSESFNSDVIIDSAIDSKLD